MFEQLFKQHYRTLCFHAMSLVNDLDASKDIVHDVFLSLWYHRDSIDFTRPMFPYLFNLTRNRALNYLEHKKIQNNHVRQHLADDPTYTLSDDPAREELLERILARIEDLRDAANVVRGRKVAAHVRAMIVPGSTLVREQAQAEGLADIFIAAGFEWRQSGCSMCLAMNDDVLAPGDRCASSTNRNFEGRQGAGARTHLMSPAMVAAAAISGRLADVRCLSREY